MMAGRRTPGYGQARAPSSGQRGLRVSRTENRAAAVSLGAGIALTSSKFVAFFLTGSAAVFSDALESIVNVAAAALAAYALYLSHRPADDEHPYGHGKVEFISAGFEGGMVLLAAVVAALLAVTTLVRPVVPPRGFALGLGIILISATVIANGALGFSLVRLGRQHGSPALEGSGRHLLSDVWCGLVALGAMVAVKLTGQPWIDPVAAFGVAILITRTGVSLVRKAFAGLMDEQDREDQATLQHLLDAHMGPTGLAPCICSYHKLRHRHSGRYHWVDFHLVLPAGLDIAAGTKSPVRSKWRLKNDLGKGMQRRSIEPCTSPECKLCRTG